MRFELPCMYCSRVLTNHRSRGLHQKHCKENPDRVPFIRSPNAGLKKGCVAHNKGKKSTKPAWNKGTKTGPLNITPERNAERINKIKETAARTGCLGGYRPGSGRGKKGKYLGIACDSSWELAFVIYCLEHGKAIERSPLRLEYEYEGEVKIYIPDFIVDGVTVEVKGYQDSKAIAKRLKFPWVRVYSKDEMKPILDYVIEKHGEDFIRLYERKMEEAKGFEPLEP